MGDTVEANVDHIGNLLFDVSILQKEEEELLCENEKKSRNVANEKLGPKSNEVLWAIELIAPVDTGSSTKNILAYNFLFGTNNPLKKPLISWLTDLHVKNGINVPWCPVFCKIECRSLDKTTDRLVGTIKKINEDIKKTYTNLPDHLHLLSNYGNEKGMLFFGNPKFFNQSFSEGNGSDFFSPSIPAKFTHLNNILKGSKRKEVLAHLATLQDMNDVKKRLLAYGAGLFPILIYKSPLAYLINSLLNVSETKQSYMDKTDKLTYDLATQLVDSTINSITELEFLVFLIILIKTNPRLAHFDSDNDKDEIRIKAHINLIYQNFQTHLKVGVEWYFEQLTYHICANFNNIFLTTPKIIPGSGVPNEQIYTLVSPNQFIQIIEKQQDIQKMVEKFEALMTEYTTRFLHLCEITLLKMTRVERMYDSDDDEELANSKNEKLYWTHIGFAPNDNATTSSLTNKINIVDFRSQYFNHVNSDWLNLLSSCNCTTMPFSIKTDNIPNDPYVPPKIILTEQSQLVQKKLNQSRYLATQEQILNLGSFLKNYLENQNVLHQFSPNQKDSLEKNVELLNNWQEMIPKFKDSHIEIAYIYLSCFYVMTSQGYYSKVKKYEPAF